MTDHPLWGGRFAGGPDPEMMRFTSSLAVDLELLPFDCAVTKAHARRLVAAGLLEGRRLAEIDAVCDELASAWRRGESLDDEEDVHTIVEKRLTERLGDVGARIHAGRSRNDLVATDLRLWCRAACDRIEAGLGDLVGALLDRAESHLDTVMPGYTHLQRAQPVSVAFHLLAHGFALQRDVERIRFARGQADVSPLGAGALAGTSLELDLEIAVRELGFSRAFDNAMDAVSDRDFAADLIYACALCAVHLSRVAEEIVMWTSAEFGFARLPDAWSTGSSMMPQKRNPDAAELVRGRAGGALGDLQALLSTLKGLPLAYDRDLQEDKEIVFRACRRIEGCLSATTHLISGLEFDADALSSAAAGGASWATDIAETLVGRGVPFREAHGAAGRLVAALEKAGLGLSDAPAEMLARAHPDLGPEDRSLADPLTSMRARRSPGGTSPEAVRAQIAALRARSRPDIG